ncbi:hypothetical protein Trydic_g15860 [Trypoxylus dichotomus]
MGKIADRIILIRLQEETDDLDVIPNCQFGFCRGNSTTHQVLRIVEQIKEGFNLRKYTGTVFLHVAKVFEKVWHQGILFKMHRVDISKAMVRLLHSPQEGIQSQAGRAVVHSQDRYSRSAATVSDLTPTVQHLHQRHPSKHPRQPGDVCISARSRDAPGMQSGKSLAFQGIARPRFFSRGRPRRRKHSNPAELIFQGGIIP